MKTFFNLILKTMVPLMILGCSHQQDASLTPQEIEQIKSEVKLAAEPLFTGWAALDGSIAIKSFSPEMVSCYDSMLLDYQSYKESWSVYTGLRESIKISTIREDYIILARDLVIDTWVGNVEEVMKSGEKVVFNPIRYTNVFRNKDGEWKIIFAQSTGIPVTVTPEQ